MLLDSPFFISIPEKLGNVDKIMLIKNPLCKNRFASTLVHLCGNINVTISDDFL